jgi:multidrug efflux pump subunit AcrA (membrane-fusion protein)
MSADYERQLLARARELADTSDLRDDTLACLGAARHAGLDPDALAGLVGCAAALGASATATYTAGDGWTGTHADERHFLAHVASVDDDLDEHITALTRLGRQATAALDAARHDLDDAGEQLAAARRGLAAAHALPTSDPCDGCHGAKAAAIAAAEAAVRTAEDSVRERQIRTGICGDITGAAPMLVRQLRHAQARLQSVPADLSETYESVYHLLQRGGVLPYEGRWLTGTGPTG